MLEVPGARSGVDGGLELLALIFLMDRSAENWAREFACLRETVGACNTAAPIKAASAMTGTFTWTCDRGNLTGAFILAPTTTTGIQALKLEVAKPD